MISIERAKELSDHYNGAILKQKFWLEDPEMEKYADTLEKIIADNEFILRLIDHWIEEQKIWKK